MGGSYMKKRINILMQTLLVLTIITYSVTAQSFEPVFEWTRRLQDGEEIEIKVQTDTTLFAFFRSQETSISQSTFADFQGQARPQQIKFLPDRDNKKLEGFEIGYEVNKLLYLRETWKGTQSSGWKKIEFIKIASYPLDSWLDFVKQAISQGLLEYEEMKYEEQLFTYFTFKRIDRSNLQLGKQTLKFPDEFYKDMKISQEFKPKTDNVDNFVIIVHEPHWWLPGQYQLVDGLKAFFESNSQYKFRFLVEGYFEKEIENISTKPLLDRFSKNTSNKSQVFSLLRNALIDGPLAYRLFYNPDLPAIAIDDKNAIQKTPPYPILENLYENHMVLSNIFEKLSKLPKEQIAKATPTVVFLSYYITGNFQDLKGEVIIDYYRQMAELYDSLFDELKSIRNYDFEKECSFLKNRATNCRREIDIYQCALERDTTMAKNIANHFKSEHSDRIPIAFIGNFHTSGILNLLSNKTGYVIIEPRSFSVPSQKEMDRFNDAIDIRTIPRVYVKKLGSGLKLPVGPLPGELPYYESFLKKEGVRIQDQENSFKSSSPLNSNVTSKLIDTLEHNGVLDAAQWNFADAGQTPPPLFPGIFASFDPNPDGENPKMIFYDRREENWKQSDRLRYLKKILPVLPHESVRKETKKVSFYQDKETNRIFFCFFDSKSQKFYLFEGERGMDIFKLLFPPKDSHIKTVLHNLIEREEKLLHG